VHFPRPGFVLHLNVLTTKYCHLDLFGTCLLSYFRESVVSRCDSRRSPAGRLKNPFGKSQLKHSILLVADAVMIWAWITLALMEAREGNFHGLSSTAVFVLQEAGGGALEGRSLTARKRSGYYRQQTLNCKLDPVESSDSN
jgi:hypothetical protein